MSSNDDRAKMFAKLRASTSKMLGITDPTPIQALKVDLASSIRLEIDRVVTQQLAGHPGDVRSLTALTESLRSLFPVADDDGHNFAGAKEELSQFLVQRAERIAARHDDEVRRLREENAVLNEQLKAQQAPDRSRPAPPDNVIPIDATARANNQPPAHYLREGQREAWRDHYDGRVTGPSAWPLPR